MGAGDPLFPACAGEGASWTHPCLHRQPGFPKWEPPRIQYQEDVCPLRSGGNIYVAILKQSGLTWTPDGFQGPSAAPCRDSQWGGVGPGRPLLWLMLMVAKLYPHLHCCAWLLHYITWDSGWIRAEVLDRHRESTDKENYQ